MQSLFLRTDQVIHIAQPAQKLAATRRLYEDWQAGALSLTHQDSVRDIQLPPLPPGLRLVEPARLQRRGLHTPEAIAAMVHAIAHIEYNAINLALDAVYRFRHMPCSYYHDWLTIAEEEACHFELVWQYLQKLGGDYGDFSAHTGLWDMAERTAHDVWLRMALVPRVLEARGLDVTPGIIERFRQAGLTEFVEILEVIQRDEIGHVAAGSWWFHYLCDERGLPRQASFEKIFRQYTQARIKSPLAKNARRQAGFTNAELNYLEGLVFREKKVMRKK